MDTHTATKPGDSQTDGACGNTLEILQTLNARTSDLAYSGDSISSMLYRSYQDLGNSVREYLRKQSQFGPDAYSKYVKILRKPSKRLLRRIHNNGLCTTANDILLKYSFAMDTLRLCNKNHPGAHDYDAWTLRFVALMSITGLPLTPKSGKCGTGVECSDDMTTNCVYALSVRDDLRDDLGPYPLRRTSTPLSLNPSQQSIRQSLPDALLARINADPLASDLWRPELHQRTPRGGESRRESEASDKNLSNSVDQLDVIVPPDGDDVSLNSSTYSSPSEAETYLEPMAASQHPHRQARLYGSCLMLTDDGILNPKRHGLIYTSQEAMAHVEVNSRSSDSGCGCSASSDDGSASYSSPWQHLCQRLDDLHELSDGDEEPEYDSMDESLEDCLSSVPPTSDFGSDFDAEHDDTYECIGDVPSLRPVVQPPPLPRRDYAVWVRRQPVQHRKPPVRPHIDDVVKDTDIVDRTSGHMYTVRDVLDNAERLFDDCPDLNDDEVPTLPPRSQSLRLPSPPQRSSLPPRRHTLPMDAAQALRRQRPVPVPTGPRSSRASSDIYPVSSQRSSLIQTRWNIDTPGILCWPTFLKNV